jgi:hypothetical protein
MIRRTRCPASFAIESLFVPLLSGVSRLLEAQSIDVVDQFNPSGMGPYIYSGGQIENVWTNWFGGSRLWRHGAPLNNDGKLLWETEVSTFDAFDGSMSNEIY